MAIQKCHECGKDVSTTAKACPNCGASVKKPLLQKNIGCLCIVVLLIVILWMCSVPSFDSYKEKAINSPTSTLIPSNKQTLASKKPVKAATPWEYSETKDEMSGKVTKFATNESLNTVNFEFPYQGAQHGTIMILDNERVLFYVEKGQVICHGGTEYGTCVVNVKFDTGKEKYVSARISGDDSTTISFTEPGFLSNLKKSKKLMIRVEVYQNSYPVFTFDVGGLVQK